MRRPSPVRQQGFGLLVFVVAIGVVAFSLVVGYSGVWTRKEAIQLVPRQNKHLDESVTLLERAWPQRAYVFDNAVGSNPTTSDEVLDYAGITRRGGLTAALSSVLTLPAEGLAYRAVVLYFPTDTDETNPPDLATFATTGKFASCVNVSADCAPRVFRVFNSLEVERALAKETVARLTKVASKAQFYFKARMLQDPEKNISVNYFRKPLGGCETLLQDLGCVDAYTPLLSMDGTTSYSRSRMAVNLGLTDEELFSAWGQPLEASNLEDSSVTDSPFSMVFRARRPLGGYFRVFALQPI